MHFCPRYRGSRWILMLRGFRICMTKGARSQKRLVMGNFQSVPRYRKGTDQKPPITRHFWLLTPLCHTYSEPSWHEDSPGPLVHGAKLHPEMPGNKYSSLGQLWVIQFPPTNPVLLNTKQYQFMLTQYHQVPTSTSTIIYHIQMSHFPSSTWDEHSCTLV